MKIKRHFRRGTYVLACTLLLSSTILAIQPASATNSYVNLTNLAPDANDGGELTYNFTWFDQIASEGENRYTVWTEWGTDWNGYSYLYDESAGTVINLSNLVSLPDHYHSEYTIVHTFSDGSPLAAWCDLTWNGTESHECMIYDGRTESVIRPVPSDPNVASRAILPDIVVDSGDEYYVAYEHGPTQSTTDIILYDSSTDTTTNVSDLLPGTEGDGRQTRHDDGYFQINADGDAYVVFHSVNNSKTKTFMYDISNDTLTDLSDEAGGEGTTGLSTSSAAHLQFLPDGSPIVLFLENSLAVDGTHANAFLYDGSTGTTTNISTLSPDADSYENTRLYFPSLMSTHALRMIDSTPYAVWGAMHEDTERRDIMFYDGDTNTTTNISAMLPEADTAWDADALIGFDANDDPYVYFWEGASFTEYALYKYSSVTDTVSTVFDNLRTVQSATLIERDDDEPYMVLQATLPNLERRIYLIDLATSNITDLSALSGVDGDPRAARPAATLADGVPFVSWLSRDLDISSTDKGYMYDGRTQEVINLDTDLLIPNGEGGSYFHTPTYLHTDEDENVILTWSAAEGLQGESDRYWYELVSTTPPENGNGDDDNGNGDDPGDDNGNGDGTPPPSSPTPSPPPASSASPPSSDSADSTPSESESGELLLEVNLTDDQRISGTYDIIINPLPENEGTYDYVELYVDNRLIATFQPDTDGVASWPWDTVRHPGEQVRIIVYGNNGATDTPLITWDFTVQMATAPDAPDTPSTAPVTPVQESGGGFGDRMRNLLLTIPAEIAVAIPYLLLLLLLILIMMLLHQSYRERLAARAAQEAYKRAKQLAEGKENFMALASHYLRTPLTLMKGGAEMLSSSSPAVGPDIQRGLSSAIAALGKSIESMLSRTQNSPMLQTITSASSLKEPVKPGKSPLFWAPLVVIGPLVIIFGQAFIRLDVYGFSFVNTASQVLLFLILAVGLYATVRGLHLTRRENRTASEQASQQLALDNARSQLIRESADTLAADLDNVRTYAPKLPAENPSQKTLREGYTQIANTLKRFRDVASITPTPSSLPFTSFSTQSLVATAQKQAAGKVQQKNVAIQADDDTQLASQHPAWVTSIVSTLLDNAVEYSPEGSHVEVDTRRKGKTATITIRDHGEGIPQDKLNELFKPFTKAQGSMDFTHPGIGLSLYADRLLAASLGGTIDMTSKPGTGTTVTVSFPTR